MGPAISRATRALALALCVLAPGSALAGTPSLELQEPRDREVVRGQPAQLRVTARAEGAAALGVEVDGQLRALIMPWSDSTLVELEPGLHRVALVGRALDDGATLRTPAVQVASFEAKAAPLGRRERNGWIAAVAFVVAVGSAAGLRRVGEL